MIEKFACAGLYVGMLFDVVKACALAVSSFEFAVRAWASSIGRYLAWS